MNRQEACLAPLSAPVHVRPRLLSTKVLYPGRLARQFTGTPPQVPLRCPRGYSWCRLDEAWGGLRTI